MRSFSIRMHSGYSERFGRDVRGVFDSWSVSTARLLAAWVLFIAPPVSACGIVWLELWQLKGPFEGVDKQGHALLIQKLGDIETSVGVKFPFYAYFKSDSASRSPVAGYGWCVPLLESRIVQTSSDLFCVYQPDGFQRYFVRDKTDPSLLRSKRPWSAKITGSVITAQCACRDKRHAKLVYRQGRLVAMEAKEGSFDFAYDGNVVAEIKEGGRVVLATQINRKTGDVAGLKLVKGRSILIEQGKRPQIQVVKGKPSVAGSIASLGGLTLADGSVQTFEYGVQATNEVLRLPDREIVWDAVTKTIKKDGEWTYSVTLARAAWNNAAIGRMNAKGQKEFQHNDLEKGIETVENVDGVRRITTRFMSGKLRGRVRKEEEIRDGVRKTLRDYAYDEKGQLMRMKQGESDMFFAYEKDGQMATIIKNGKVIRNYTTNGLSLAQPYVK